MFPNSFHKSDEIFIKDLDDTVEKAKKEGGEDVQIVYLTHIGPLYTATNTIVENGEVLSIHSSEPTLETVFIELTGKELV